jgi:lipoprotein NlpD
MRATLALVWFALVLGGCAEQPRRPGDGSSYIVRPEDTLYSIAWRHGLDLQDVARWNHIGSDYRIAVGQVLTLTGPAAPLRAAPATPAPGVAAAPRPRVSPAMPGHRDAPPVPAAPLDPAITAIAWQWPTDASGAPQPVPGGGILISGELGQDVRAATAGRVVYNGNGIRGYGNLIILKHGDVVLTAYAHNRDSLVHEGQEVLAGQRIAHLGEGVPNKPVLYFEIRLNGRPIDALAALPARR